MNNNSTMIMDSKCILIMSHAQETEVSDRLARSPYTPFKFVADRLRKIIVQRISGIYVYTYNMYQPCHKTHGIRQKI